MILSSLTDVEERSLALESRAFSRPGQRHLLWAMGDTTWERVLRWVLLALLVAAIVARVTGRLSDLTDGCCDWTGVVLPLRRLHDRSPSTTIDLTLSDGEIVGVVGANEAGKSTLCLVASGLAPGSIGGALTGGGLTIDGEAMAGQPLHAFATRVGIGFQNSATQLSGVTGTVFEEVALGPMNLGLPARETIERTHDALARLGIEHLAEREPRRLSGGQAQLVVLASLLAMRPPHLVLDEPTAQLDPEGTRLVGEALRHLASTGTALLIAEHKTDLLDGLCTRVVVDRRRADRGSTARRTTSSPTRGSAIAASSRRRGSGSPRALAVRGLDPRWPWR